VFLPAILAELAAFTPVILPPLLATILTVFPAFLA
jgi:hypothetical protein